MRTREVRRLGIHQGRRLLVGGPRAPAALGRRMGAVAKHLTFSAFHASIPSTPRRGGSLLCKHAEIPGHEMQAVLGP